MHTLHIELALSPIDNLTTDDLRAAAAALTGLAAAIDSGEMPPLADSHLAVSITAPDV